MGEWTSEQGHQLNPEVNFRPDHPVRTAATWALGVFAALLVAFFFRAAPLDLDPVRSSNAPGQFDTQRAIERLGHVLDGTPHPVDSTALDETRARLLQEIRALGYAPELRASNVCQSLSGTAVRCAFVQNIFFTAGPSGEPALVLTAHYDSVDASPGFGDDGIGLAVWLEVAQLLKQQPPSKPVVFLLTDGEETGLLGAQAFADNQDDYPFTVGRIINLEARGVRGPAMMFETGHPNAALVSDWSRSGARPFSNSMMTAIYELLPNSTDLTVHINAGFNGINIAISDGLDFYHTNRDDLAQLDRASVQHMGDQALGATRAFLASDWTDDASAGEIVYSDIGSRLFVSLPQVFSLVLLGLCFGVALMLLVRPTRDGGWQKLDARALALPPVLVAASGLSAFVLQQAISLVRPETAFWVAHPQAFNMAIFAVTLLLAALSLGWLAPKSTREALYASGWFWFLIVGMGLSFAVAGFSMIFLIPGVVFVLAGGAGWLFPRYQLIAYGVASAMLALMFFPIVQLLDVTMGMGMAAMFGVVEAMVLAPLLAMVGAIPSGRVKVIAPLGGVALIATIITILAPANSADRPLPLNFTAHYDIDANVAAVFAGARPGALPEAVLSQLTIGAHPSPPGAAPNLASKAISFNPPGPASASIVSDTTDADGKRTIRLQLTAPEARQVRLRIPAADNPIAVAFGGASYAFRGSPTEVYIFEVIGRAANGATVDIMLAPKPEGSETRPLAWLVQGYWTQLPDDAGSLAAARPENAVYIQMGDVSVTTKKLPL